MISFDKEEGSSPEILPFSMRKSSPNARVCDLSVPDILPRFSIRDYVHAARSKEIKRNWPFSAKSLQLCLKHDVRDVLPPFHNLGVLRKGGSKTTKVRSSVERYSKQRKEEPVLDARPCRDVDDNDYPSTTTISSPLKTARNCVVNRGRNPSLKSGSTAAEDSLVSDSMASKLCPVCKAFSSSSNTTLNAHIDQCLSAHTTSLLADSSKGTRHKIKPRKTRLMTDVYASALRCTVEDLDRRNGTNWSSSSLAENKDGAQNKMWPACPENDDEDRISSPDFAVGNHGRRSSRGNKSSSKKKKKRVAQRNTCPQPPAQNGNCFSHSGLASKTWNNFMSRNDVKDGHLAAKRLPNAESGTFKPWKCSKRRCLRKKMRCKAHLPQNMPVESDHLLIGSSSMPKDNKDLTISSVSGEKSFQDNHEVSSIKVPTAILKGTYRPGVKTSRSARAILNKARRFSKFRRSIMSGGSITEVEKWRELRKSKLHSKVLTSRQFSQVPLTNEENERGERRSGTCLGKRKFLQNSCGKMISRNHERTGDERSTILPESTANHTRHIGGETLLISSSPSTGFIGLSAFQSLGSYSGRAADSNFCDVEVVAANMPEDTITEAFQGNSFPPIFIPGPPGSYLPSPEDFRGRSSLTASRVQSSMDLPEVVDGDSSDSPISAASIISNSIGNVVDTSTTVSKDVLENVESGVEPLLPTNIGMEISYPEIGFLNIKRDQPCCCQRKDTYSHCEGTHLVTRSSSITSAIENPANSGAIPRQSRFNSWTDYHEGLRSSTVNGDSAMSRSNPILRLMGKNLMVVNKDYQSTAQIPPNPHQSLQPSTTLPSGENPLIVGQYFDAESFKSPYEPPAYMIRDHHHSNHSFGNHFVRGVNNGWWRETNSRSTNFIPCLRLPISSYNQSILQGESPALQHTNADLVTLRQTDPSSVGHLPSSGGLSLTENHTRTESPSSFCPLRSPAFYYHSGYA